MKVFSFVFFLSIVFSALSNGSVQVRHGVSQNTELQTSSDVQSLQNLRVGDAVASVSNSSRLFIHGELSHLEAYSGEALSVTFDDGETVIVSKNQPFLVNIIGPKTEDVCSINDKDCLLSQSLTFREAQYLQIGDVLPTQFGGIRFITHIQDLDGEYPLISLTVPYHHTFVLKNGVVLHNVFPAVLAPLVGVFGPLGLVGLGAGILTSLYVGHHGSDIFSGDKKDDESSLDSVKSSEKADSSNDEAELSHLLALPRKGLDYISDENLVEYFQKAKKGDFDAQRHLGSILNALEYYEDAFLWKKRAAASGEPSDQYNLGMRYYTGEGISKNITKATYWFEKAAQQGHDGAQENLGSIYQYEQMDYEKAFYWYEKSAKQGNDQAQLSLGWMYYTGHGVSQNYRMAFYWYEKAAEQGNTRAQSQLLYLKRLQDEGHIPKTFYSKGEEEKPSVHTSPPHETSKDDLKTESPVGEKIDVESESPINRQGAGDLTGPGYERYEGDKLDILFDSKIPDTVDKVGGRYPINAGYAGSKYPVEKLPEYLQKKYPNGVEFDEKGFPNFKPYTKKEVQVEGLIGDHDYDFDKANKIAGYKEKPDGYTWHHHQDGKTMQLVPQDLHYHVRHTGGVSTLKHNHKVE